MISSGAIALQLILEYPGDLRKRHPSHSRLCAYYQAARQLIADAVAKLYARNAPYSSPYPDRCPRMLRICLRILTLKRII